MNTKLMSNDRVIYGGQAVIEGVMMRSARRMAVAVRNPSGKIELFTKTLSGPLRGRMARQPFVRGIVGLIDAFGLGMRSLMYSAAVSEGNEADYDGPLEIGTILASLGLGIGLFFFASGNSG